MRGGAWRAAAHGVAKSWTQLSDFTFTFHFHALEKEMATCSIVLAWKITGTGEPGGLPSMGSHRVGQSMGSHRVGHDWSYLAAAAIYWRIKERLLIAHLLDCYKQVKQTNKQKPYLQRKCIHYLKWTSSRTAHQTPWRTTVTVYHKKENDSSSKTKLKSMEYYNLTERKFNIVVKLNKLQENSERQFNEFMNKINEQKECFAKETESEVVQSCPTLCDPSRLLRP